MATNSKEIKRRIKSTQSIAKITKAMELVSAAKMRKAQGAALASRPYAKLSTELLQNLTGKADLSRQPLLRKVIEDPQARTSKILAILVTSDRGLAGALNSNVAAKAVSLLKEEGSEKFDFIAVGSKGLDILKRSGASILAAFPGKDKAITLADATPIARIAIEEFVANRYEKVFIIYTDFISTLVQKPNILQLLPFEAPSGEGRAERAETDFLFEPSPDEVLENLVERTVEFAVFQSIVEAAASEHSARMVAMRNANEAAGELIDDLSLTYNQARQAGITRELSEISAAKLAMEG